MVKSLERKETTEQKQNIKKLSKEKKNKIYFEEKPEKMKELILMKHARL